MSEMSFYQWPNQVRKIWYGENEYGFSDAQEKTRALGFELVLCEDWQFKLRPLA